MCKHCKLKKKVKKLEAELAELKATVDSHVGHYIYPYPYSVYPYGSGVAAGGNTINPITWTIGNSGTIYDNGNWGASSES